MWTLPTSSVHSCSSHLSVALCFQALRMMLGLDLVAVHHRNLTLNNLHVPNGQPLFQNGKNILRYNSELLPFLSDYQHKMIWHLAKNIHTPHLEVAISSNYNLTVFVSTVPQVFGSFHSFSWWNCSSSTRFSAERWCTAVFGAVSVNLLGWVGLWFGPKP